MRHIMILALLSTVACSMADGGPPSSSGTLRVDEEHGDTMKVEHHQCESFEILDFGSVTARQLGGGAWVGSSPPQPLRGVRVVAKRVATGEESLSLTSSDGSFDVGPLDAGQYEVSVCIEGFDELVFQLTIESTSEVTGLQLFLGPSEAAGRRDVVPIQAPR